MRTVANDLLHEDSCVVLLAAFEQLADLPLLDHREVALLVRELLEPDDERLELHLSLVAIPLGLRGEHGEQGAAARLDKTTRMPAPCLQRLW